ncbi:MULTISPECIES: acyl-CoA thioesterase II [Acidithrix]|uniref:Acyl-CoA thioesterase 2 n=1 Tax=Acidithrix ferrooxidans TaxID=1280514 RepID=A0A0D8HJG7_9ACTN|nr:MULTISPECIES: acyl-CoA thioesterase II [Acidithrix]KJF17999.1 acyl-CoA thioesterase 2 [Acidithrix ferrooxidans]
MTDSLDALITLLDLDQIEENIFRGYSPEEHRMRVFGGQVAGQALVAAGRTVSKGNVHSLHAYFLRPGDPRIPIVYLVDRIRDGKSFTTRRVIALQRGEAIFNLSASFHIQEPGIDHQSEMPDVPDPLSLPTFKEKMAPYAKRMGEWYSRPRPLDQRYITEPNMFKTQEKREPYQRVWVRADGTLPDDPLLHACVIAYASDMTLLDSVMLPHKVSWDQPGVMVASLDHAMWFHRQFRADEWFLYDQESPTASGSRGLARGQIFSSDGRLVVSVVQEGLVRIINQEIQDF